MDVKPTLVELSGSVLCLPGAGGQIAVESPARFADAPQGWAAMAFHVDTDADVHAGWWEMHPTGDEALYVLAGGLRLILRAAPDYSDAGEGAARVAAGQAVIVPRGRWHRLELDEPSDLFTITPRRGTRRERRS